jgi:predicted NBD/HSP70 family sugar kinase
LEVYVGIPAILSSISSVHGEITFQEATRLLKAGDPASQRVFADAATLIGRVLGMLTNALNPDVIVLGGALSEVSSHLMPELRAGLVGASLPINHGVKIVAGSLGKDASAMGALGTALDSWLVAL